MKTSKFKISPHTYKSGGEAFGVSGTLNGVRRREFFPTQAEALTCKQNWEREAMNVAPLPSVTTKLTTDQCGEAESCFRRLAGFPLSLSQVVDFALANYRKTARTITVAKAYEQFISEKKLANLRPATLQKLRGRLCRLVDTLGALNIGDIQPDALRPLIFRDGSGNVNRDSDYRVFSSFFNWAMTMEYCAVNPLAKIAKIKLDRAEPVILTLPQVRKFIGAAAGYQGALLVPYVVLGLFCAIRPTEIARLTWDNVDLDAQTVTIGAEIAKCRARRIVKISDNAAAFLHEHVVKRTPLSPVNWRRHFDAVKTAAGLTLWTMDIMRHTGISYHLAQHEHEGKTASWAGNSPTVIQQHYKGLVKPADAAAYWTIQPGENKIITLEQEAA